MANPETCRFGVLTASDRASKGEYEDLSGPAIEGFLEEALTSDWEVERRLVEDERESIEAALIDLIDNLGCSVVVTTGGTGPSQRDVTPEATENVCEKILPGFGADESGVDEARPHGHAL
jgi:molybdopterin adenylyltransferase